MVPCFLLTRAFCLTVNGEKGEMKGKNIQLKIVKLPHEIDTDKSYHEVGNCQLHLHVYLNGYSALDYVDNKDMTETL